MNVHLKPLKACLSLEASTNVLITQPGSLIMTVHTISLQQLRTLQL